MIGLLLTSVCCTATPAGVACPDTACCCQGRLQQQREGGRLAELQRRFAADVLQRMAWAQPENVQHLLRDGACPFCSKPGSCACQPMLLLEDV